MGREEGTTMERFASNVRDMYYVIWQITFPVFAFVAAVAITVGGAMLILAPLLVGLTLQEGGFSLSMLGPTYSPGDRLSWYWGLANAIWVFVVLPMVGAGAKTWVDR